MRTLPESDRALDDGLAARIVARVYGALLGVLFGIPLAVLVGASGTWFIVFVAGFALAISFVIHRVMTGVPNAVAGFVQRMIYPSGYTTPYAKVYSMEQSIAARGDVEGALDAYQDAMRLNPTDPEPRFQAAELAFRSKDPSRAIALFNEGRRLAGDDRSRELYATQRLIDLYLGPLKNDPRALVELRRLIDRFPNTREGKSAVDVIRRLKAEATREDG
jgi:hypothetical protein